MNESLRKIPYWGALALLAYMPFSLFFSRWVSLYTGGLGQWDALKDVATLLGLFLTIYLAIRDKLLNNPFFIKIFWLSAAYGLLHAVYLVFNPDLHLRSLILAILYNGRIFAYLFIGMVAGRYLKKNYDTKKIIKIILLVSTITCLFAFVQYLLPKDLMTHFGYSVERGAKPSFFIDDKIDLPRVFSTIRDPNSYGAYLILPMVLIWQLLLSKKSDFNRKRLLGVMGVHILALFLTFSRGAWIGAVMALSFASFHQFKYSFKTTFKKYLPLLAVIILFVASTAFYWRNSYLIENVILHSDEQTVLADPNELRLSLQAQAIRGIADKPLGHGPGTAGLVSIGNPKGTFLTENYYLQIGYELGLFGLGLFIFINYFVYKKLLTLHSPLFTVLIACFWAYLFIGTLIHIWSNEAVAAQWWLLAGLALGVSYNKRIAKLS